MTRGVGSLVYDRRRGGGPMCRILDCPDLVVGGAERLFCEDHAVEARALRSAGQLPVRAKKPYPKRGRPPRTEDRYVDSAGYAHVRIDGRFYPEHRIVMMAMLGRPLFPGESVHHRNGQRADNRPRNLELWVGPIRRGARASDLTCVHCGKPWLAQQPRRPQVPIERVAAKVAAGEWPALPSSAPPGFFERFKKSVQAFLDPADPEPYQAALWGEDA